MAPRMIPALAPLLLLAGCSLSAAVTRSSLDYAQVLEAVTDDMLATNVLLARDQAPLHFTDLSQIRGSLQLQAQSQISEPFGSLFNSDEPPRAMLNGLVGGATNPTFDVVPLNTKSFTEGINAPIDAKYFQYLVNRDEDDGRSVTIPKLFFAKLRLVWRDGAGLHGCSYFNSSNRTAPAIADPGCAAQATAVFGDGVGPGGYFDLVARALQADAYYVKQPPEPIARNIRLSGADLLRNPSAWTTPALHLEPDRDNRRDGDRYDLSRDTGRGVYCLRTRERPGGLPGQASWMVVRIASLTDPVDASSGADPVDVCGSHDPAAASSPATPTVLLYVRSVEGIFQYLGRMLLLGADDRALPFFIERRKPDHLRFSVGYRGDTYYVAQSGDRCAAGTCRPDQTLFILAVLNQLLDLYKSGSEIPVTPAVQSVP